MILMMLVLKKLFEQQGSRVLRWQIRSGSHCAIMDPSPIRIPEKGLVPPKQGMLEWQNRDQGQGSAMAYGYFVPVLTFSESDVCSKVLFLSVMGSGATPFCLFPSTCHSRKSMSVLPGFCLTVFEYKFSEQRQRGIGKFKKLGNKLGTNYSYCSSKGPPYNHPKPSIQTHFLLFLNPELLDPFSLVSSLAYSHAILSSSFMQGYSLSIHVFLFFLILTQMRAQLKFCFLHKSSPNHPTAHSREQNWHYCSSFAILTLLAHSYTWGSFRTGYILLFCKF